MQVQLNGVNLRSKSWRSFVFGASITVAVVAMIHGLRGTSYSIPNPPAILLLCVVFSASIGGLKCGFLSSFIVWAYIAYYFSLPNAPFHFSEENERRVLVWAAAIPLMAWMVGRLNERLETSVRVELAVRMAVEAEQLQIRTEELVLKTAALNEEIRERKRAQDAAEGANRAKSAFLANMSHEIRTPLGVILGFSELLYEKNHSPEDRALWNATVRRNGIMLSTIINDILDLSKVEAGRLETEIGPVDIAGLVSDLKALLDLKASDKGLVFQMNVDPDVPSVIRTDSLRLRQVLLNVIGNAIKFTKIGKVSVRIKWAPDVVGAAKIAIVIQDTGLGIAPEFAERIFEPFSQADASTTRKFGGTGLGLALSRDLARALGGDIVLSDSVLGATSTFIVTVDPRLNHGSEPGTKIETKVKSLSTAPSLDNLKLSGMRILLTEDSVDNQVLVTHILGAAGATVEIANNGSEALKKVENKEYDVILMDLQMPVMGGYEAMASLRGQGYLKPIIALTAHALTEEHGLCLAAGFSDHMSKPFDHAALVRRLAQFRVMS